MVVLNHSNDRGLAVIGGRGSNNCSFGAIKSIDNVGRLTDVMTFTGKSGQGVDNIILYTGDSTTTTERLRIDSDGKVSIGTDSIGGKLTVTSNSSNTSLTGHNYLASQSGIILQNRTSSSGHFTAYTGNVVSSGGYTQSGSLAFEATGSGTTPKIHITQRTGSGVQTKRLTIDTNGRSIFYQDSGSTNNAYAIVSEFNAKTSGSAAANFGPALYLTHTFGGTNYAGSLITSQTDADVNTTHISFYPRNYGWTEALRITKDGQLVIGDSSSASPAALLHLYQASNDPYIIIQRGSGDSANAIGGISWKNSTYTTAGIYGFTDDLDDGTLRFHTSEGGSNTEKLHITKGGAVVVQREHLQIQRDGTNSTNFTKGGLVFATPAYNEYHYTWSGQSSYTIDLTCGSYYHAEFIYVQHQTNGGVEMQYYVRGKWANNHTTHTGIIWELHGDGGGLAVDFTVSDQSGNGSVNMKNNLSDTSNSQAGNGYVNGGGEGQNTGSANGRFRIEESYSWGSVAGRSLIIKQYYGSHSISKS